ncbi:MAG: hypothetical protein ACHREM_10035, partial [Polyangiales bacterium]
MSTMCGPRALRSRALAMLAAGAAACAGCGLDSSGTGTSSSLNQDSTVAPDTSSDDGAIDTPSPPEAGFDVVVDTMSGSPDVVDTDILDGAVVDSSADVWPPYFDVGVSDGAVPCSEPNSATLGGHCYFQIGALDWWAAEAACEATSPPAHLVAINDIAEQT